MPRLSIIIPCYNAGLYIGEAIESVLEEEIGAQVVVIDDGSTDNSVNEILRFSSRIELIRQEQKGVAHARNAAITRLTGDYTLLLDADDCVAPKGLKMLLNATSSNPNEIVYGMFECWDSGMTKPLTRHLPPSLAQNPIPQLTEANMAPPGIYLFPTRIFSDIGRFEQAVAGCEDWDFLMRAAESGYSFKRIPRVVFRYRRSSGTASTHPKKMLDAGLLVISRAFERRSSSMNELSNDDQRRLQFLFASESFGLSCLQGDTEIMEVVLQTTPLPSSAPVKDYFQRMRRSILWHSIPYGENAQKIAFSAIETGLMFLVNRCPNIFGHEAAIRYATHSNWKSLILRPGPRKAIRLIREEIWGHRVRATLLQRRK